MSVANRSYGRGKRYKRALDFILITCMSGNLFILTSSEKVRFFEDLHRSVNILVNAHSVDTMI